MSTRTIQSLPLSEKFPRWLLLVCFALLSIYPIYRNFYYSNGIQTYERHRAVIEGRSEFYNPWQYRIFSPYVIEGMMWLYNYTIDKLYPIEEKLHFNIENTSGTGAETDKFLQQMKTPGVMKYMLLFILFRWSLHLIIFYLLWKYWRYFIDDTWLLFFGINFTALAFGNAVAAADLSFNTYVDIILYLFTAIIIVYKRNPLWLLPIVLIGAFNRETSMLIPALFFVSNTDLSKFSLPKFSFSNIVWPPKKVWVLTGLLYILFFCIFIGLRMHYGYREQQVWKVPAGLPMLRLNLFSAVGAKAYMELIGTFGVIPLLLLYTFKSFPPLLKKWFIFLVPVWFLVHFMSVVAYQTRLFMVPFVIIFMPMMMLLVQQRISKLTMNKPF